jgi:hypothetical protein
MQPGRLRLLSLQTTETSEYNDHVSRGGLTKKRSREHRRKTENLGDSHA